MDIDTYLLRLAEEPVPDLSGIDGAALAVRARSERREGRTVVASAAVIALAVGVFGSALPGERAEASIVPFGPPTALAPLVELGRG